MEWDLQNLIQVFLVVGGLAYVVWGAVTGDVLRIGLGVLAATMGVVGLVRDRRSADATDPGDGGDPEDPDAGRS